MIHQLASAPDSPADGAAFEYQKGGKTGFHHHVETLAYHRDAMGRPGLECVPRRVRRAHQASGGAGNAENYARWSRAASSWAEQSELFARYDGVFLDKNSAASPTACTSAHGRRE